MKRYTYVMYGDEYPAVAMEQADDGDYVLYKDAKSELATLRAKNASLAVLVAESVPQAELAAARDAVIEECAKIVDAAAIQITQWENEGIVQSAAAAIRALKHKP